MTNITGFTLEEYIFRARAIGLEDEQIARQLGLSKEDLIAKLNEKSEIGNKRSAKVEEKKQRDKEIKEQIKEKKAKGYTNAAIAEQMDIAEATVLAYEKEENITD